MLKLIGAGLIITACGGFGMGMAVQYRREISSLKQFMDAVQWMRRELEYHLTPVPELCRGAAEQSSGQLRRFWIQTAVELESQIAPDVSTCMGAAIHKVGSLPKYTAAAVEQLRRNFGSFDLEVQQDELACIVEHCNNVLTELEENKTQRLRNYQTLWLCAGAALAILLV